MEFLFFLAGVAVGALGMFFVYKNNQKEFKAAAAEMDAKHQALKAKFGK